MRGFIIVAGHGNRIITASASTTTVGGSIGDSGSNFSLTKAGAGTLALNGLSTYAGGTIVTAGTLSIGAAGNLGANVTGNSVIVKGGILALGATTNLGSNQTITLASNAASLSVLTLSTNSLPASLAVSGTLPGVIAINTAGFTAVTTEAFSGGDVFLGSTGTGTLANTSLGAGSDGNYRLGGGGGTLTVANGILSGSSNLIVGSTQANGGGTVILQSSNSLSGTTSITGSSILNLSGATANLASSAVTANAGSTLLFDSSAGGTLGATRTASLALKGGNLNISGNATANSTETITGALTAGAPSTWGSAGANTVSVTPGAMNVQLVAGSLTRNDRGAVYFRGTNLGQNTIASNTAGASNISFVSSPSAQLVGGGGAAGSLNISILPWAVGSTAATGSPTSFVTYDANGIRPLASSEYDTTLTGGTTTTNNVKLAAATPVTANGATTINSLFLSNSATSATVLAGTGALTVTSGAIYADLTLGGNSIVLTISKPIDFGSAQGVIGTMGTGNSKTLSFAGGISGSGGISIYDTNTVSTNQAGVNLSVANTYTGDTFINGQAIVANLNALPNFSNSGRTGDVYVNGTLGLSGTNNGSLRMNGLFGNGRVITPFSNNITLITGDNNATSTFTGTITQTTGAISLTKIGTGTLTLSGTSSTWTAATNIQNGTLSAVSLNSVTGGAASSSLGAPTTVAAGTIGLGSTTTTGTLKVTGSGETTDRVINLAGTTGGGTLDQSGTGLLKFTSDFTATGAGSKTLTLQGSTAGTGEISGAIVDTTSTHKTSVTKSGTGTWTLSGNNSFTGVTAVSAGKLSISSTGTINSTSGITIGAAEFNYNNSTTALSQNVSFSGTNGTLSGTGNITTAVTVTSGNRQTAGSSVTAANPAATIGKSTFDTGITYNSGSIFEWNLTGDTETTIGSRGVQYDAVNTANLEGTGGAIFRVILNGSQDFSETFWNTDRVWAGIFKNVLESSAFNLSTVFNGGFQYQNSEGTVSGATTSQGSFTFVNGGQDLKWSAVPEAGNMLVGLLIGAGLLRRRRALP